MEPIKILVVDDHKLFREGLIALLNAAPETAVNPFPDLTDREREVLALIAQGLSNSDIGDRLHISGKTVSNHISNKFNKLHVASRAEDIVKARDADMV